MAKMEIVMFNMSSITEWRKGIVNRNRHVFYQLLDQPETKRMIAVDFLPFSFKRAVRNYWENIIRGIKGKTVYRSLFTKCKKLDVLDYLNSDNLNKEVVDLDKESLGKKYSEKEVYIFSTVASIFSHKLVIKELKKALLKIQDQSDYHRPLARMTWSYFPMFVEYFNNFPTDLTVFDAVDNWVEHPSFKRFKKKLTDNYKIIAKKSDLVFTVAESLVSFFKDLGRTKSTTWVANGVDTAFFQKTGKQLPAKLEKFFEQVKKPIIGYIGTIQNRIDIRLLEYLAEKNPNVSFVLVGPLWPVFLRKFRPQSIEIKRLKKLKNIHLLGRRPYTESPALLKKFDITIIPHKLDEFIKYTYSLKVLEYLSAGKPVITTPPSGVGRFAHLVYIAQDYQEFDRKVDLALKENKLKAKERQQLREQRRRGVEQEDWKYKVEEMMKKVRSKIK